MDRNELYQLYHFMDGGAGAGVLVDGTLEVDVAVENLNFHNTADFFLLSHYECLPLLERFNSIVAFLDILEKITKKGYINETNLLEYPLFSRVLPYFISYDRLLEHHHYVSGRQVGVSYK